jgi:hypothetical protein
MNTTVKPDDTKDVIRPALTPSPETERSTTMYNRRLATVLHEQQVNTLIGLVRTAKGSGQSSTRVKRGIQKHLRLLSGG